MTELERLCRQYDITIDCVYGAAEPWPDHWAERECHPWTVTLSWFGPEGERISKQKPLTLTTSFFQGVAHDSEPTAADVLSCLLSDLSASDHACFEDWAGEYGYNPDSRQAEQIYRACLRMAPRVCAFFSGDGELLDEFRGAEH